MLISIQAQDDDFVCGIETVNDDSLNSIQIQVGGLYKPAVNAPGEYLRALIVFVQFDDDSVENSGWPRNELPIWNGDFIDSTPSSNYRDLTFSDYWKEMARGNFDFIGDVYPNLVILPSEAYYDTTGKNHSDCNQDVLAIIDADPNVDFTQYDNWRFNAAIDSFEFLPDNYVDMMFIIYRNPDEPKGENWFGKFSARAALSYKDTWQKINEFEYTTSEGIIVSSGNGSISKLGSGITVRTGFSGHYKLINILAHEYGHYLFGGYHWNYSGIMGGGTYALNGWERERLGYIAHTNVTQNNFTVTLSDFIKYGDILRIPIPITDQNSSTYFLVENHQRESSYDQIMRGGSINGGYNFNTSLGSGIYVWLVEYGNFSIPEFYAFTADGKWNWQYDGDYYAGPGWYVGEPWEGYLPKTKRQAVNRHLGKSDRMPKHIIWNGEWAKKWVDILPDASTYTLTLNAMGDEYDAFNMDYNEIFSPWSNPSTYVNGTTNISMQLFSQSGNDITLKVYSTQSAAENLPPSTPQMLVKSMQNTYPKLTWEANIEPDINQYEIWKKNSPTGDWFLYTTTTNNSFTDENNNFAEVVYKIRAVDNDNKYSVFTSERSLNPGTVSSNTTWSGSFTVRLNITIENGAVLTIDPGSNILFDDDIIITANNGYIDAFGTSQSPITFSSNNINQQKGDWFGIKIDGQAIYWDYCNIEYATYGLLLLNDAYFGGSFLNFKHNSRGINASHSLPPEIYECLFEDNSIGIFLNGCSSSQNWNYAPIHNNTFIDNNYGVLAFYESSTLSENTFIDNSRAMQFSHSNPVLNKNVIDSSSSTGIYVYSSSNPAAYYREEADFGGYNIITNNGFNGVKNTGSCLTELGFYDFIFDHGGYNQIYGNTDYEVYNSNTEYIYAKLNWWGQDYNSKDGGGGSPSLYGNVYWQPCLSSPPAGKSSSSGDYAFMADSSSAMPVEIQFAYYEEIHGRYESAAREFNNYFAKNPTKSFSKMSVLKYINNLKNYLKVEEVIKEVETTRAEIKDSAINFELSYGLIDLMTYQESYDEALKESGALLQGKTDKNQENRLLLQKGDIYSFGLEDEETGKKYYEQVLYNNEKDNEYHEIAEISLELIGEDNSSSSLAKAASGNPEEAEAVELPESFKFYGNHPNPFNPSTSFRFYAPWAGSVTMVIHNYLGQSIRTIKNPRFSKGEQKIVWNGKNEFEQRVSSGVYFTHLIVQSFSDKKERHEKFSKVILLK